MGERIFVDQNKRLSDSLLWEIQRRYFLGSGITAWQDDVVPHAISCSPLMARTYLQLIWGYLRDISADSSIKLTPDEPLTIIELGAGSGRLTWHLMQQLYPRYADSVFTDIPLKFVLTDFVPKTIEFWQTQPLFAPWVEAGILDFALFDVEAMAPLELLHAGTRLSAETTTNPIVLLANYFFDSIPQDAFVIEDGQLFENRLSLSTHQPLSQLDDSALWEQLQLHYQTTAVEDIDSFFSNAHYNQILQEIVDEFVASDAEIGRFSFPTRGLDCLSYFQSWGRDVLLLASDRGYTLPDSLIDRDDPLPNLHGSFSLMVNFDAIGRYAALTDGVMLHTPHYQDSLQTVACLLGHVPQAAAETQLAFEQSVTVNGPDDFQTLKSLVETTYAAMTLPQLLAWLRTSAYDAHIFLDCYTVFAQRVAECNPVWHADIAETLRHIWELYLPLDETSLVEARISDLFALIELNTPEP